MPLVRYCVRNEYGLGVKELYKDGVEAEDPKPVLDGVAVAALVGLLRQLGDLSQFAAEVFHGLQEQVASTASRSRKLVSRVQRVEASLPSLEKAMLSQTSHIHFSYTPGVWLRTSDPLTPLWSGDFDAQGFEWHPRIRNKQNHFICDDLPHFIMDSYEGCREPPRLQLLDRFDTGGPGSCLKRYSDPTFFRQSSASSEASNGEKSLRERKTRKIKKRKSWQRSGLLRNYELNMNGSGRAQVSSQTARGLSTQSHMDGSKTGSTFDMTFKSDQSDSVGSKEGQNFTEHDSHLSTSVHPNKTQTRENISTVDGDMDISMTGFSPTVDLNELIAKSCTDNQCKPASEITVPRSSNVTWDEKLETMEHMGLNCGSDDVQYAPCPNSCPQEHDVKSVVMEVKPADTKGDQLGDVSDPGRIPMSDADGHYCRTTMDRNFVEPLEHLHEQEVKPVYVESHNQVEDLSEPGSSPAFNANDEHTVTNLSGGTVELTGLDCGIDEVQDLHETNFDLSGNDMSQPVPESLSQVTDLLEGEDTLKLFSEGSIMSDPSDDKFDYLLDSNGCAKWEIEQIDAERVGSSFPQGTVSKVESTFASTADGNFMSDPSDSKLAISDIQYMLEKDRYTGNLELATVTADYVDNVDTFSEDENNVNAIEWHHHDDIDSETDNFVDALNTIESESESDYESQTKKVALLISKYELAENTAHDLMTDGIIHPEAEYECHPTPYDHRDGVYADSEQPSTSISLSSSESLENAQPSQSQSEAAIGEEENESLHLSHEQSVRSDSPSLANVSEGIKFCANADEPRLQPAMCDIAASSSEASPDSSAGCTPRASQEMAFKSTSSFSHAFWTNGTLFGLEPSKPTVPGVSNSSSSAPVSTNSDNVGKCSPEAGSRAGPPSSSAMDSHHYNNIDSDSQDIGSFTHTPLNVSEETSSNKLLDRDESKLSSGTVLHDLSNGHAALHESRVPVGANCKETFSEASSTNEDRSSILSLLDRGLKNGLRRSGSLGYDAKSNVWNPSTISDFQNLCRIVASDPLTVPNLNGKLHSPVNSPPPSPPLEHMKFSFHPFDVFETSRLKLSYPEGIDCHEGTVDMFPSFQLAPESTRLQQSMASESDDDTFCHSYPCLSVDAVSNLSDPDSEQWESGDTSDSNEHAYYDGLRRMTSLEPGASSPEHDEKDQGSAVHSVSGPTSQLPFVHTRKQFAYREMQVCLNPDGDCPHLQVLMPQPPPPPPLLWRTLKPMQDAAEEKPEHGADLNQSSDSKLVNFTISHPASLDSAKLQSKIPEPDKIAIRNKFDELKVNDQKQDFHIANGRTMDHREDFLRQIRSKSFNLKRTETTRALHTPSPAASNKATAILQKANAIRKAVGSDGKDDNWSDT